MVKGMLIGCIDISHITVIFHSIPSSLMLQKTGIDKILPGTIIDDYLFEPCGYSMNGILPNVRAIIHSI